MTGNIAAAVELIRNPVLSEPEDAAAAVMKTLGDYRGKENELLLLLRECKSEMRARNVPGNTAEHIYECDYLETIPSIVMDDRMYKLVTDLEREIDHGLVDDVDLRTVSQLYLELVDIVVIDLREACKECRRYPFEKNLSAAIHCLDILAILFRACAKQLSLHSTDSPASMRAKGAKAVARCKEHVSSVTHGTGIVAPELDNALDILLDTFWSICQSDELAELQERRNARYREDNKRLHGWMVQKVMDMNGEMEALDLTDLTQRRYLQHLISITQDWINAYNGDH